MKKLLMLFIFTVLFAPGRSQTAYLFTPTIIPEYPTSADVVKIVTRVTTPQLAFAIDPTTFSIIQNLKEIDISACYYLSVAMAIGDYKDTLVIGQLAPGTYLIKQKFYTSSKVQICQPFDTNSVNLNFVVTTTTGFKENQKNAVKIFPNPANDRVYIENSGFEKVTIYSAEGRVLKAMDLKGKTEIDISVLCEGLYFMRLSGNEKEEIVKFLKM